MEIYGQYRNGCEKVDISSTQGDEWESLWIGYVQSLSECGEGARYCPQSKQNEREGEAEVEHKQRGAVVGKNGEQKDAWQNNSCILEQK